MVAINNKIKNLQLTTKQKIDIINILEKQVKKKGMKAKK